MTRNELLKARLLQASQDISTLNEFMLKLSVEREVEAGPQSEDTARSLEQSIQNAQFFVGRLLEFAKARPE